MARGGLELEVTELKLGLPGDNDYGIIDGKSKINKKKKREFFDLDDVMDGGGVVKSEAAAAAVGWPPVCFYRNRQRDVEEASDGNKKMVKISVDGVPFLRKVNLCDLSDYSLLFAALENLFACFGIGELKDGGNSKYVPIYEDKDGDWLLVGDVPWEMFVESCKRLRIMKRSDAKGFGRFAAN